jgi:class 3 adenylate cyclase
MTDKNSNLYNAFFGLNSDPLAGNDPWNIFSPLSAEKPSRLLSLASLIPDPPPPVPDENVTNFYSLASLLGKPEENPPNRLAALAGLYPPVTAPRPLPSVYPPVAPRPVARPKFAHASPPQSGSVAWVQSVVSGLLKKKAEVNNGRVLPEIEDLAPMEGRRVRAAFVYSDLHGFTKLVSTQLTNTSFLFLHSFVYVTNLLTKHYGGQVMDCAGDRVLSVFHRPPSDLSNEPVEDAITFALWLQTVFTRAIAPAFTSAGFAGLSLGIGVDYGEAVVGCVGIRNDKRIVFFGDAANKAAKLQEVAGPGETMLSFGAVSRRPAYLNGETWKPQGELQNGEYVQRISQVFAADVAPKAR